LPPPVGLYLTLWRRTTRDCPTFFPGSSPGLAQSRKSYHKVMKISDTGEKVFGQKTKIFAKGKFGFSIRFSVATFLWSVFLAIVIVELFVIYGSLYKNLTFTKSSPADATPAIVRVDFEKYEKVIERLNEVEFFQSSNFINFQGNDENTGRDNPFSDPE